MTKYNCMITTKKINDWLHDEVFVRLETAPGLCARCVVIRIMLKKKIAKQIHL